MRKFFEGLKIRTFLALFILLCILVPAFSAMIFAYNFTHNTIDTQYMENYTTPIFSEIDGRLSIMLSKMNVFTLHLLGYSEIQSIVDSDQLDYAEKQNRLQDIFNKLMTNITLADSIDYVTAKGDLYRFGSHSADFAPPSDTFLRSLSNTQFSFSTECAKKDGQYFCIVGKNVRSYSTNYNLGSIIFYIDEEQLGATHSVMNSNESIFFVSNDEKIISHPDKRYLGSLMYLPTEWFQDTDVFPGTFKNYRFASYDVTNPSIANHIQISGIVSNRLLYATMNTIIRYILYSFVLTALLAIAVATLLSKSLIYRISRLKQNMENFTPDFRAPKLAKPSNEIAVLELSFDKMAREIKGLISSIEIQKEKQRIAELNALQSQINPHFIYNALDSISWKAKENKQYEIDDMLITLATFFRNGLHRGETLIKISDELEHVKSYLAIESTRFPDLFETTYDIDESILDCMTVKIILQPVVENSIKHGFRSMEKDRLPGHIHIKAYRENDDILFDITDNGMGMELKDGEPPRSSKEKGGYGLYNVNERLHMYYGDGYGLRVTSEPNRGTRVVIRISVTSPIKTDPPPAV